MGILLLPVCAGAAEALWKVARASGAADTVWISMFSGAACWVAIFFLLPKPMWLYVVGHELTHALCTWAMGGKVKKIKASANGGHLVVTRTNFLIALAPYFFPFYALLIAGAFALGSWFWDWRPFLMWFHFLLGMGYAFHLTLTWHALQNRQSDIEDQGWIFSLVIIFLGNISVLLVGIPLLAAKVDVLTALRWWCEQTGEIVRRIAALT